MRPWAVLEDFGRDQARFKVSDARLARIAQPSLVAFVPLVKSGVIDVPTGFGLQPSGNFSDAEAPVEIIKCLPEQV